MALPVPNKAQAIAAFIDVSKRFSELVRTAPDPSATAIGHWTVLQTAKHTSHIFDLFPRLLEGGSSPVADHRKLAEAWDQHLADDDETDLGRVADRIDASVARFTENIAKIGWEDIVEWHGGLKIPAYSLACILINEGAIHGLDIAGASGRNWNISEQQARFVIQGLLPILPHFVKEETAAGMDALYELKVRGSEPVFLKVEDGRLTFGKDGGRSVDCKMSVNPVDYLLIGYGRKGQWGPILTGRVVAYGRKPWLGLKFGKLFVSP
jgi:uncharacterized protein (TIGR03083 family)